LVTESGRLSLVRSSQPQKSTEGISMRFDGGSNVKDDNSSHSSKIYLPRLETEEGTVKEVRLEEQLKP
jgi:hypothetical protein